MRSRSQFGDDAEALAISHAGELPAAAVDCPFPAEMTPVSINQSTVAIRRDVLPVNKLKKALRECKLPPGLTDVKQVKCTVIDALNLRSLWSQ